MNNDELIKLDNDILYTRDIIKEKVTQFVLKNIEKLEELENIFGNYKRI